MITFPASSVTVTACATIDIATDSFVECDHDFSVAFDSVVDCELTSSLTTPAPATVVISDSNGMYFIPRKPNIITCVSGSHTIEKLLATIEYFSPVSSGLSVYFSI